MTGPATAGPASAAVLVLAKAPEPGRVKTRLCPPATPEQAADLAAAALLDTLDAATGVVGAATVVALAGSPMHAARRGAITAALAPLRVIAQRGDGLGARIEAAHADTAQLYPGLPTLQVGMDTPQVEAALLTACLQHLTCGDVDAVLGPAADGGWWALGLRRPLAAALIRDVPTSRDDTGERTLEALRAGGLRVGLLPVLSDVDTVVDAQHVARVAPGTRFAATVTRTFGKQAG